MIDGLMERLITIRDPEPSLEDIVSIVVRNDFLPNRTHFGASQGEHVLDVELVRGDDVGDEGVVVDVDKLPVPFGGDLVELSAQRTLRRSQELQRRLVGVVLDEIDHFFENIPLDRHHRNHGLPLIRALGCAFREPWHGEQRKWGWEEEEEEEEKEEKKKNQIKSNQKEKKKKI